MVSARLGRPGTCVALVAVAACALAGPAAALPRVGSSEGGISITFWDRPNLQTATARLSGLGTVVTLVPDAGVWTLLPNRDGVRDAAANRPRVRAAEWPLARTTHEITDPPPEVTPPLATLAPDVPPTDPYFVPSSQWGLFDPATTWSTALISQDPRPPIAILDGGIDATHEEWSGPDSPLIFPRNTYSGSNDTRDNGRTGHGTHVAGISAAPVNGLGIVGVAPARQGTAPIIPIKIADTDGRSTDETMIKGIKWAVNHGAKVINISAGGPGYSQAFQNVVNWAFPRALIVASVGNEGLEGNDLNYPAAYDHVLGVGAQCDNEVVKPECPVAYGPVGFTNHNRSLDIIAPGVNVISSVPRRVSERRESDGYALKDGTSMAAPFISGVAALVFAQNYDAATNQYPTPDQVLRQLERTAIDVATPGRDALAGHGKVNPAAAVTTPLPARDLTESNDDVLQISGIASLKDTSLPATIPHASIDFYDDPNDVYPVLLSKGQAISLKVTAPGVVVALRLWKPSARSVVRGHRGYDVALRLATSDATRLGPKTLKTRAPARGRYYIHVAAISGSGDYDLSIRPGARTTP